MFLALRSWLPLAKTVNLAVWAFSSNFRMISHCLAIWWCLKIGIFHFFNTIWPLSLSPPCDTQLLPSADSLSYRLFSAKFGKVLKIRKNSLKVVFWKIQKNTPTEFIKILDIQNNTSETKKRPLILVERFGKILRIRKNATAEFGNILWNFFLKTDCIFFNFSL